jgi:hypothetical protein
VFLVCLNSVSCVQCSLCLNYVSCVQCSLCLNYAHINFLCYSLTIQVTVESGGYAKLEDLNNNPSSTISFNGRTAHKEMVFHFDFKTTKSVCQHIVLLWTHLCYIVAYFNRILAASGIFRTVVRCLKVKMENHLHVLTI